MDSQLTEWVRITGENYLIECSVLFSFFVNELNEGVEGILMFVETKLKGLDNIMKERGFKMI